MASASRSWRAGAACGCAKMEVGAISTNTACNMPLVDVEVECDATVANGEGG